MIKTPFNYTSYKDQPLLLLEPDNNSYLKNKPKRRKSSRSKVLADFGFRSKGSGQTNPLDFHQIHSRRNKIEFYGLEFTFPSQLRGFYKTLQDAVEILSLEDNWDGEGALKIDKNAWLRAANFLDVYAKRLYEMESAVLEEPFISPVPNGSVDVVWENNNVRLLLNFKVDSETAGYYGDFYSDNNTFKGIIPTFGIEDHFVSWLKNFKKDV